MNLREDEEFNMKKNFLITAIFTVALAITTSVYAKPMFFGNPVYDLRNLNHVKVSEIVIPYGADINVDMAADRIMGAVYEGGQKNKVQIIDVRQSGKDIDTEMKVGNRNVIGGYLQVTVNKMSITQVVEPGYWHKVTKYEERVWYDRENRKHVDKIPYEVDEWVPESVHNDGHISVQYKLYDGSNMDVYATSTDTRDKIFCDDVSGMLKRSATDFFKAIRKANK